MANNKVQLSDGTVLLDLTGDTVTPETLMAGVIAHDAAGEQIVGEAASGGMTQEEADARYLQLSGGTMTGDLTLKAYPKQAEDGETYGQFKVMLDTTVDGYDPIPLLCYSGGDGALFLLGEPDENDASAGDEPLVTNIIDCNGVHFTNVGSQAMNPMAENDFFLPTMYDVKEYVGTIARKVTLTTSGWNSSTKQQTVAVSGILADGTKQMVICSPVDESYDSVWSACYVQCVGHAADSLTFQCDEIPTAAVEVFVSIQPISFVS